MIDDFKLIRSKRKTMALIINDEAKLIVRAPLKSKINDIQQFVERNQNWIINKKQEVEIKLSLKPVYRFEEGEMFPYLGNNYPLRLKENAEYAFYFKNNEFILNRAFSHKAKQALIMWYKKVAIKLFNERASFIAANYNFQYKKIKLSNADRRWGSCSSKGTINLSWKLILAPLEIIDYVIAHELSHLIEMNHSKRFWQIVNNIIPYHREARRWLRKNSHLLEI